MWYKTSNRKPYYDLKQSQINFFTEYVRFIHESNTIESQFEKPYLDEDYHKMHLNYPRPSWLGAADSVGCMWVLKKEAGDKVLMQMGNYYAVERKGAYTAACAYCVEIAGCGGFSFNGNTQAGWFEASFSNHFNGTDSYTSVTGDGHCVGSTGCKGSIPPNACDGKDVLRFTIKHRSNFCREQVGQGGEGCVKTATLPCDPCLDPPPMTWTTAPTVMTRAQSLLVSFSGGVGPYTWSGSCTGGTVTFSYGTTTTGTTNYVNVSVDACGSVDLTVTDSCSQTLTLEIRITDSGKWCKTDECTVVGTTNCNIVSSTCCCPSGGSDRLARISGTVGKYWSMTCYCGLSLSWCTNYPTRCNCPSACSEVYANDCPAYLPPTEGLYPYGTCHSYTSCKWEWKCPTSCQEKYGN